MRPLPINNPFRRTEGTTIEGRGVGSLPTLKGHVQSASSALQLAYFKVGGSSLGSYLGGALFFQLGRHTLGSNEVLK
jgi:hypothetical protein